MTVAIVDYGSGNLRSAAKAFERAGRDSGREQPVLVTGDPEAVRRADRIVLPGVGAFGDCRDGLAALTGMIEAMNEAAVARGRPFLGICVGMQLMATVGREHGDYRGLGWIAGEVVRMAPDGAGLKVPHMGWNELEPRAPEHPLLAGLAQPGDGPVHAYFVHSYVFRPADPADLIAATDYGGEVAAMVGRGNLAGTQFHPEKSQAAGLRLIANFLGWSP
jgi:glutamine amidotransferase